MAMTDNRVETTTSGSGALMRDLENFLGLTDTARKRVDNGTPKEAELNSEARLEQVRELQRKVDIPQQLVDAVSPRADEGLLELMVRIAEDPTEWRRVHLQLQQLDQDLIASRDSLEKLKAVGTTHETQKKDVLESNHINTKRLNNLNVSEEASRDHKKNQGPLEEEQERVAALGDDFEGDKGPRTEGLTMTSTDNKESRPKSMEAEQQMVAGMDDELSHDKSSMNKKLTMEAIEASKTESNSNPKDKEKVVSTGDKQDKAVKRIDDAVNRVHAELQGSKIKMDEKEGKKKKKKKPKNKGKHRGNRTNKGEKDIRRDQLEKAGVLSPISTANEEKQNEENNSSHPKDVTKSSSAWKGTPKATLRKTSHGSKSNIDNKTYKVTEADNQSNNKSHGQKLSTIDSAIAYFSETKEPEVEDKWQKVTSRYKNINGKHEIDKMEGRKSNPNSSRNSGMKLSSTKGTRITNPPWQTLSSDNYRMPSKEERSNAKPPYYSDINYDRPRDEWPNLSLDSMKHGGNTDRQWSAITNMVNKQHKLHPNSKNKSAMDKIMKSWPKFPPDISSEKENSVDRDNWPNFQSDHIDKGQWTKSSLESALSNHISSTWPQKEGSSGHRTAGSGSGGNRQWPHFAYHRVTSSPQVLAQQRARHRNAYIAVSVVGPPGSKSRTLHKSQSTPTGTGLSTNISSSGNSIGSSSSTTTLSSGKGESGHSQPLPDKMDQLLAIRSEQRAMDPLEEQLVDVAAATSRGTLPWSHARHLDRIQEQLKTLSAMEEKLRYHWLEKERLRQILRDGGKNGAGFYREPRNGGSNKSEDTAVTTSTTSPTLMATSSSPSATNSSKAP